MNAKISLSRTPISAPPTRVQFSLQADAVDCFIDRARHQCHVVIGVHLGGDRCAILAVADITPTMIATLCSFGLSNATSIEGEGLIAYTVPVS